MYIRCIKISVCGLEVKVSKLGLNLFEVRPMSGAAMLRELLGISTRRIEDKRVLRSGPL